MKETREEIRARLLRDNNTIRAIQMRAYEIWQIRGRYDGRSHEDWLLAENEVVSFLLEQELRKAVTAIQEVSAPEVVIIEEVVAEPAIVAVIEEAPVVAELETASEPKPRKRATKATTAKAAKATGDKAAPKKTSSRKKAAEVEQAVANEKDAAPKKATTKRTIATKKTTTKKSAKPEQPAAE